jgi:hypothetical protein
MVRRLEAARRFETGRYVVTRMSGSPLDHNKQVMDVRPWASENAGSAHIAPAVDVAFDNHVCDLQAFYRGTMRDSARSATVVRRFK